MKRDPRGRLRDPNFVSFLAATNDRRRDAEHHGSVLRSRKLVRQILLGVIAGGGAWVLLESARALSLF